MNLVIDPQVFLTADSRDDCKGALIDLEKNKAFLLFVLDRNILKKAYIDFLEKNYKNRKLAVALTLIRYILSCPRKLIVEPCSLSPKAQKIVKAKCSSTIEKHLLCLATEMAKTKVSMGLILLLTGPPNSGTRCLHQTSIKTDLQNEISGLEVGYASDGKSILRFYKDPANITNERQHVNIFELQARIWVNNHYQCQIISTLRKVNNEEIDVYCYQDTKTPKRLACVGECKLRFEDEDKPIEVSAIKQLTRKIQAVKNYEQARNDVSGGPEFKGLIISNTRNMTDDAWILAKKLGVMFLRVNMPKGWKDNPAWSLSDGDWEEIPYPD